MENPSGIHSVQRLQKLGAELQPAPSVPGGEVMPVLSSATLGAAAALESSKAFPGAGILRYCCSGCAGGNVP